MRIRLRITIINMKQKRTNERAKRKPIEITNSRRKAIHLNNRAFAFCLFIIYSCILWAHRLDATVNNVWNSIQLLIFSVIGLALCIYFVSFAFSSLLLRSVLCGVRSHSRCDEFYSRAGLINLLKAIKNHLIILWTLGHSCDYSSVAKEHSRSASFVVWSALIRIWLHTW